MREVRLIGYWRNERHPEYPDPAALVDETWSDDERDLVGIYLMSGTSLRAFMGYSSCRICGVLNGTGEFTDGEWAWPEGLAHYVLDHNVRLPEEFVRHTKARVADLESTTASLEWWLASTC